MHTLLISVTLLAAAFDEADCYRAQSMAEMRLCNEQGGRAEVAVQDAYDSALKRLNELGHGDLRDRLVESQKAWLAYRKTFCSTISDRWGSGTIRDAYFNACMMERAQQRIAELAQHIGLEEPRVPFFEAPREERR